MCPLVFFLLPVVLVGESAHMLLYSACWVLNVKIGPGVQIVITWAITLLAAAWWLLRPVLTTWKGVAWVAGVLLAVMMCVQVCTF